MLYQYLGNWLPLVTHQGLGLAWTYEINGLVNGRPKPMKFMGISQRIPIYEVSITHLQGGAPYLAKLVL